MRKLPIHKWICDLGLLLTLGMQTVKTFREVFALFIKDIILYCVGVEVVLVWLGKITQMMVLVFILFLC